MITPQRRNNCQSVRIGRIKPSGARPPRKRSHVPVAYKVRLLGWAHDEKTSLQRQASTGARAAAP